MARHGEAKQSKARFFLMIEIEFPFPVSINAYYRRVGQRTLISFRGRAFREKVCSIIANSGHEKLEGPLEVHLEIYPPDKRKRDVDNYQKSLLDAMEHGGLYKNDNQIIKLETTKCEPVAGGGVIVRIWEID